MFTVISRIVPNYELAPDLQQIEILRVVVRESMSEVVRIISSLLDLILRASHLDQLIDRLVSDIVSDKHLVTIVLRF